MNGVAFVDLAAGFHRRFRMVPADTAMLRDVGFRLRHAVYCQELAFEPVQKNRRERDEWDAEAIHCLVQSLISDHYVGYARLVVPPLLDPRTPLPFERVCADAIDPAVIDPQRLPRASVAEVSRLTVISDFRRYGRKKASPSVLAEGVTRTQEPTASPCVLVGLYLGLLALARVHGINTLFMLVEPRLARYLGILTGYRPQIIGRSIEYRGPRVPAMLRVPEIWDRFNELVQPMVAAISTDIRSFCPNNEGGNVLRSVMGEQETVARSEPAA